MKNPWLRVPSDPPYFQPLDEDTLAERYPLTDSDNKIHLECLPEPFQGRLDAPVVVLGLKPGFDPGDPAAHRDPAFMEAARRSLAHEPLPYPVYLLDPRFAGTPGGKYYREALKALAGELGAGPADVHHAAWKAIANGVLFVSYFPYHSVATKLHTKPLTSQMYGFHLARQAIDRAALVLVVMGDAWWSRSVKELASAPRVFRARNVRTWTLSANNLPGGFEEAVRELRAFI
jgi:hypothetical protein